MAPAVSGIKVNENGIPAFEELPIQNGDPIYAAWGLYGPSDELGTLNRLTDARVAAAARSEIKSGARISLNWPLDAQANSAFFTRQAFHQDMFPKPPRTVNDDVWTFNSQSSSQWDGLRHYGYQKEKKFYNGVTMEDLYEPNKEGKRSTVNGIHVWSEQGIVGRGVLVDFHSWRLKQENSAHKEFDPFNTTPITLTDIKACLAAQGTEVQFGDILIIRSGWMAAYAAKTDEQLRELKAQVGHRFCGVQQGEDMLKWIWENFSAVAGDHPAFECWPTNREWAMHEILLAGWGCPIGELFHLEKLAEHCKREKRWSFFVASEPCNVTGGVASPPNILAIF